MTRLGLIVGSGELPWRMTWKSVGGRETGFGAASMTPELGVVGGCEIVRLARHGVPHQIAPHAVNYRANLSVLDAQRVESIVAINTVGGISVQAPAGKIVLPDQLIDYTWGRAQTFSADNAVQHIDFSSPYDEGLRSRLLSAADAVGLNVEPAGTMGVTQGPRLETAGEIQRMARDGCDLVGMTGMPEAVLARELEIPFVSVCLVVNPAAGVQNMALDLSEIRSVAARGMKEIGALLLGFFEQFQRVEGGG